MTFVIFVVIAIITCLFPIAGQCADPWDYNSLGSDWQGVCSKGRRQSPIPLSLKEAVFDSELGELQFTYNNKTKGYYKNNGRTVSFQLTDDNTSKVTGGGLGDEYTFSSLHFHWGQGSCEGSEHVISYTRFPLELHMVHFNTKYGSFQEAVTKHDGIAVVGILFTGVKGSVKASKLGKFLADEYGPILGQLVIPNAIVAVNLAKYVEDLAVSNKFFRYKGSLTTPTCDETVTWTVMTTPLTVDFAVLAKFREIKLENAAKTEQKTGVNYREIQQLNGRTVYSNDIKATGSTASAVSASPSNTFIFLLVLAVSAAARFP